MSEPFLGEIVMFAGNFAPRGWAFCQGQLLSIAQNTALFSILGTTYGGNGQTTFALPDFRGRVPMGTGQGPGLSPRTLGEESGTETVTLLSTQMPAHTHTASAQLHASTLAADDTLPAGNFPADGGSYRTTTDTTMNANAVTVTNGISGGSQPFSIVQPYLVINFIIAIEGIFPSRN
ncbi:MAG: phage tail protein [Acidobacteria bacterium]|nr:MAG: phage tail protein [Acidobacteriota bacterium]